MSKLMVDGENRDRTLASMVIVRALHDLERNNEDAELFFFSDAYMASRQLWFDASNVDVRLLYKCIDKIIASRSKTKAHGIQHVSSDKLRQFRESLGLNQREFATRLGFTQSCVSVAESKGGSTYKKDTGVVAAIIRMFGNVFESPPSG